jgi:hypothetical protein
MVCRLDPEDKTKVAAILTLRKRECLEVAVAGEAVSPMLSWQPSINSHGSKRTEHHYMHF